MKRRKFLELSALSSASALLLNGHQVKAFSKTALLNQLPASIIEGRSLVLIQLLGGNDGLNTLIPINQYDAYASLRPTVKLETTGINGAISLDSTLPIEDQIYLHPSLTGFKSLYDAGKLNIIQSVGYPIGNKSHFASRALMLKGGDGTSENSNKTSGWMARFLHTGYNYEAYSDPLGIQLGAKKPSLGFHSEHEHKVDVNLTGQNVSGYYNVISSIGNPEPTNLPDSEFAANVAYMVQTEKATNDYSQRISEVFDAGSNSAVSYPDYDLADQLKTVARMIKGGSKTKIFLVTTGGYDTHADQVVGGATHTGTHANLLAELGDSVKAFQDDIEAMGIDEKVVAATFTEFGRKPLENGNLGTDHGNLGPMFVIGSSIKPGVTGSNLDLSTIVKHFDEGQMQHDYRQVFTTLITDFLGASTDVVSGTEFSDFDGEEKLNLIDNSLKALGSDYPTNKTENNLTVYPNPIEEYVTVQFTSKNSFRGFVVVYDLAGALVAKFPKDFMYGVNALPLLDLKNFKSGYYILAIKDSYNTTYARQRILKK